MRDDLEVCSRLEIKGTGLVDFAFCSGDECRVSLVAAVDCISCEVRRLAVGGPNVVDDLCDFVELFVFLSQAINFVVLLKDFF